jgi:hypothetical protein
MGVITISLDKKTESKLRDSAVIMYGAQKGAISKTITHAINQLEIDKKGSNKKELFNLMDNPAKVKGTMPKHRRELYER